jgi:CBS domain containing-hemolysin-like protein
VETVGGLIMALLGRPPQPGDQVELGGAIFTVEQVKGFAVETARLTLRTDAPDSR